MRMPHAWVHFLIVAISIGSWMVAQSPALGACYKSSKYGIGFEMPPEALQRKVLRQMNAGTAPKFRAVSMNDIKWASGHEGVRHDLWGCHCDSPIVVLKFGVEILIWDQLKGLDRHFTLMHEFTHKIFDWEHPIKPHC